jgi:hypothetical protein
MSLTNSRPASPAWTWADLRLARVSVREDRIEDPTERAPVEVVYLLGMPRSGSTVLGNLLGECEGCVSVGELCLTWSGWLTGKRLCGCGLAVGECPFWEAVRTEAFRDGLDPRPLAEFAHRLNTTRRLPSLLGRFTDGVAASEDVSRYQGALARLYRAIARVTNTNVIIDSTKSPGTAVVIESTPGIRLHVLHLVRDSRGVLNSHRSRADQPYRARSDLLLWDLWNLFAELRWGRHPRYLRVRYEDFAAAPEDTLKHILAHIGHSAGRSPMLGRDLAQLGTHHTVGGNPNRFTIGEIRLTPDSRWRRELPVHDRALAMMLTGPVLLRYGYLRPRVRLV